jgi:hypothetical protein
MDRILKVFVSGVDQDRLAKNVKLLERYDAFVLAQAPAATAKRIARN